MDTIVAVATAPGYGGIGVVRVSGPQVKAIIEQVVKQNLTPRFATYLPFYKNEEVLDKGIAIYFPGPNSYTGEDVLELQGHGGPVVLDRILSTVISLGARPAKAGEFTERAYLNDKMDLSQAEAIIDLINSSTEQAAQAAVKSMQGEFSTEIHELVEKLIHLRVFIEASLDFSGEEIDFLQEQQIQKQTQALQDNIETILSTAHQGHLLQEGLSVAIAGKPNAGKSSLLNCFVGKEIAIVTDIAGTTRDVMREQINIDGMPVNILDTAGIRESDDIIEQEGIKRAFQAFENADLILILLDVKDKDTQIEVSIVDPLPKNIKTITVYNKIDLAKQQVKVEKNKDSTQVWISAKQKIGIDELKQEIKKTVGYKQTSEGTFIARRRHITALEEAKTFINMAVNELNVGSYAELAAENLLQAQNALNTITGEFSNDDLLGRIFEGFCIGK